MDNYGKTTRPEPKEGDPIQKRTNFFKRTYERPPSSICLLHFHFWWCSQCNQRIYGSGESQTLCGRNIRNLPTRTILSSSYNICWPAWILEFISYFFVNHGQMNFSQRYTRKDSTSSKWDLNFFKMFEFMFQASASTRPIIVQHFDSLTRKISCKILSLNRIWRCFMIAIDNINVIGRIWSPW